MVKFFLPESDDLVDPGFDFKRDMYSAPSVEERHDVYVHEIFDQPPFDGVLVSKSNIDPGDEKIIKEGGGIHQHLRLPDEYPVIGDCGAFQFIGAEIPPYTPEQIFDYYSDLGFDYGITLDHVIVEFDPQFDLSDVSPLTQPIGVEQIQFSFGDVEKSQASPVPSDRMLYRFRITLDNAREMLRLVEERRSGFQPIGSAQGWSPESYHVAVKELIGMGYEYIAIGGVARASDAVIQSILDAIRDTVIKADVGLHILGVARFSLLEDYQKTNVRSCDSAATLMQAFKSAKANYRGPNEEYYTCVRIPSVGLDDDLDPSPKVYKHKEIIDLREECDKAEKALKADKKNSDLKKEYEKKKTAIEKKRRQLADLESKAHTAVRAYAEKKRSLDDIMNDLIHYESEFEEGSKFLELYRRTLEDRPWEKCACTICQNIGVEVVIMRGNNRNRRRGFHNTYVFFNEFKKRLGREA
jgi:hypothetical protein